MLEEKGSRRRPHPGWKTNSSPFLVLLYWRKDPSLLRGLFTDRGHRAPGAQTQAQQHTLPPDPTTHSGNVSPQLAHYTDLLRIAGGVGIAACLPFLRHRLVVEGTEPLWSSRRKGLASALVSAVAGPSRSVQLANVVGDRPKMETIQMVAASDSPPAIVVCGPPDMANYVRCN
ncbi:hypothetical protein LZ31DRAFT_624736 [Colletotrichum somersetense]|nr:hypothetical protein LZ31DRAFT_624736 [Colletotrichum somersetense]